MFATARPWYAAEQVVVDHAGLIGLGLVGQGVVDFCGRPGRHRADTQLVGQGDGGVGFGGPPVRVLDSAVVEAVDGGLAGGQLIGDLFPNPVLGAGGLADGHRFDDERAQALHEAAAQQLAAGGVTGLAGDVLDRRADGAEQFRGPGGAGAADHQRGLRAVGGDGADDRHIGEQGSRLLGNDGRDLLLQRCRPGVQVGEQRSARHVRRGCGRGPQRSLAAGQAHNQVRPGDGVRHLLEPGDLSRGQVVGRVEARHRPPLCGEPGRVQRPGLTQSDNSYAHCLPPCSLTV